MIELSHINKTFHLKSGDVNALDDVSLRIEEGSVYGVIGYSGAGKSTLVRCLNLLEVPDSGSLSIDDSTIEFRNGNPFVNGKPMRIRQQNELRRGIGMIFQHFNLLDRSTVFNNIAYPLRFSKRYTRQQIDERVRSLLELVGLTDKVDVYPSQLSGGQKQRVAIARALAAEPRILLSDEATSALDPEATESILNLLRKLNRTLGITIVIITHEMAVIKAIADRVAVMEEGHIAEEGNVYDIFAEPKAAITKRFISSASTLAKIDKLIEEDSELVRVKEGELLVKLVFRKDCVSEHVLTTAVRQYGFDFNLSLANVEYLQENPLGGLIGIMSGSKESVDGGIDFLNRNNVIVEVLKDGSVH